MNGWRMRAAAVRSASFENLDTNGPDLIESLLNNLATALKRVMFHQNAF